MGMIENVKYPDLPLEMQELFDTVGMSAFCNLVNTYGGASVYIPKQEFFMRQDRNEQIIAEFNGKNYRKLAKKYGMSEVWIRKIVSEGRTKHD